MESLDGVENDIEPSSKRAKTEEHNSSPSRSTTLSMVKAIAYLAPVLAEAVDA